MEGHEVAAQVAATVVAAIVGSIIGAILGAKEGAKATHDATMIAVDADAKAAQRRREEEDRAALLALASECRSNATTLRTDKNLTPILAFSLHYAKVPSPLLRPRSLVSIEKHNVSLNRPQVNSPGSISW
jgi:hypothetical protein